jgi:hypothetical protein
LLFGVIMLTVISVAVIPMTSITDTWHDHFYFPTGWPAKRKFFFFPSRYGPEFGPSIFYVGDQDVVFRRVHKIKLDVDMEDVASWLHVVSICW